MKHYFLRYVYGILSLLFIQNTIAQQDFYGGYTPVVTAVPTAADTTKASSATVDLTTGAAQYVVPIYSIKQNGISWGVKYTFAAKEVFSPIPERELETLVSIELRRFAAGKKTANK